MIWAKSVLQSIRDFFQLAVAILYYFFTGKNSIMGAHALIRGFCATGGYSSDVLAFLAKLKKQDKAVANHSGILGALSSNKRHEINHALRFNGYYIFEERLSS